MTTTTTTTTFFFPLFITDMISYLLENISQILIFILLSYVTIFRREFSCNSTYHSNNNNNNSNNNDNSDSDTLEWKVQKKKFENDNDWMKENDIAAAAATPSNATTESDPTILNNNNNIQHQHDSSSLSSPSTSSTTILKETTPFLFLNLNTDLQIHILTYLHPKDIINVTSCNKNIYQSFMNTNVDTIIWIRLWIRDYSWILHDWKIGNEALRRSLSSLLLLCKKDNIHGDRSSCSSCSHILEILQLIIVPKLSSSSSSSSSSDQSLIDDINSMIALNKYKHSNDTISSSSPLPSSLQHEKKNHDNNNDNTIISMKEFYLTFSQIWINYTIAGHSTYNSCLTAIHGHIFNITNFLHIHPGSPESLILQGGGRDATTFFESVGHSLSARKMAVRELVEIVDLSCCSGYGDVGLYDHDEVDKCTSSSSLSSSSSAALSSSSLSNWPLTGLKSSLMKSDYTYDNLSLLPKHRSRPKRTMGTLSKIRQKIQIGEAQAKVKAEVIAQYLEENSHIVGDVNVYYDPFCCRWMGWYLDSNFDPVFIDELE